MKKDNLYIIKIEEKNLICVYQIKIYIGENELEYVCFSVSLSKYNFVIS